MIRRPPRSTLDRSSAASDVYKRQSDDFPEPDSPVMTTRRWRGMSTSIFLRLWTRAPRTAIQSWAMRTVRVPIVCRNDDLNAFAVRRAGLEAHPYSSSRPLQVEHP